MLPHETFPTQYAWIHLRHSCCKERHYQPRDYWFQESRTPIRQRQHIGRAVGHVERNIGIPQWTCMMLARRSSVYFLPVDTVNTYDTRCIGVHVFLNQTVQFDKEGNVFHNLYGTCWKSFSTDFHQCPYIFAWFARVDESGSSRNIVLLASYLFGNPSVWIITEQPKESCEGHVILKIPC